MRKKLRVTAPPDGRRIWFNKLTVEEAEKLQQLFEEDFSIEKVAKHINLFIGLEYAVSIRERDHETQLIRRFGEKVGYEKLHELIDKVYEDWLKNLLSHARTELSGLEWSIFEREIRSRKYGVVKRGLLKKIPNSSIYLIAFDRSTIGNNNSYYLFRRIYDQFPIK